MVTNKVEFKAQKTPPNPKEVDYWVDTATNPNGGSIKYHNGSTWTNLQNSSGGSGMNETASNLLIAILRNGTYNQDVSQIISDLEKQMNVSSKKILIGITVQYTGGTVSVNTALNDLTGITVTAVYSDGSTEIITDYQLSGEITKGKSVIVVSYQNKTDMFTITGISVEVQGVKSKATATYSTNQMTISRRTDRATLIPAGQYLVGGKSYTFSLGEVASKYWYGIQTTKTTTPGLQFEVTDTDTALVFSGVGTRLIDSGWMHDDYSYNAESENILLWVNFKKTNDSTFTEEDCEELKQNFKIIEQ